MPTRGWQASFLAIAVCLLPGTVGRAAPSDAAVQSVTYHLEPGGTLKSLQARYSDRELLLLQKLNRIDIQVLTSLRQLVVPDVWVEDDLAYSPLPRIYPQAEAVPTLLVVHQAVQAFGAYENGVLVRWGPVSTGRAAARTPSGLYHLNWKSPGRQSTVNPEWFMPWYFNFDNISGNALHAYSLPGLPASHGCIRLLTSDAIWLYGWGQGWRLDRRGRQIVEDGTTLLITGEYDFTSPPPWRSPEVARRIVALPADPFRSR